MPRVADNALAIKKCLSCEREDCVNCLEHRIRKPRKKKNPLWREAVLDVLNNGYSRAEAAEKYGVSATSIWNWICAYQKQEDHINE